MLIPALLFTSYLIFVAALVTPGLSTSQALARVNRLFGTTQAVRMPYPMPGLRMRALALATGSVLAVPLVVVLPLLGAAPTIGFLLAPLGYVVYISRYVSGWPKRLIGGMEQELPSLTSFVSVLAGIGTLPVPTALLIYADQFPDRPLATLMRRTPTGLDPVQFLLELGIPSVPVNGALSVLSKAQQNPHRRSALKQLYESQESRVRLELEATIEGRVAKAPVATVMLLLPALLVTALAPVVVRFLQLMGGI